MFNGKMKAVTFSFDDGITQDIRFVELLNKYGLKCTFNLNSSLLGLLGSINDNGTPISHIKVKPSDVKYIYEGHEVAAHTLTHPKLVELDNDIITYQVEKDRLALSELVGYDVVGMAYPGGEPNNDERVAKVIKETTGIKYARTIKCSHSFDIQNDLYRFNPTVYHGDDVKMLEFADKFINLNPKKPQLLYIWGHSYNLDMNRKANWEFIEEFFKIISGKNDIFYGTNKEILLNPIFEV